MLVGPNGSGKSTVLEAVGVACAGDVATAFHALSRREWLGLAGMQHWIPSGTAKVTGSMGTAPRVMTLTLDPGTRPDLLGAARSAGAVGTLAPFNANGTQALIDSDGVVQARHSAGAQSPIAFSLLTACIAALDATPVGALVRAFVDPSRPFP